MKMIPESEFQTIDVDMIGLDEHYVVQIRELTLSQKAWEAGDIRLARNHLYSAWAAIADLEDEFDMADAFVEYLDLNGDSPIECFWSETGGCSKSLFAMLPDCSQCLTMVQNFLTGNKQFGDEDAVPYHEIVTRYTIPQTPDMVAVTDLVRFAKAQTEAIALAAK